MDLSLRSIKTNNWLVDNFNKHVTSVSCTLKPAIQSDDTGQQMTFLTAVNLTITWMSIKISSIKLNTDFIRLGHLAGHYKKTADQSMQTTVAI